MRPCYCSTGLDVESARKVIEPLRRLMAGRTTIIISHDLSITREADRVVVLKRGRVAQTGTHEELLSQDGVYARLYRTGHAETFPETVGAMEEQA